MLFSLCILMLWAFTPQKATLPVDASGKYTFAGIVEVPGISKKELYEAGKEFMKKVKVLHKRKSYLTEDNQQSALTGKGSFIVHKPGSLKKHPDGAVIYDLKLEFKDGKYRYLITNYLFIEYRKGRYGKYGPVKGKLTPLESAPSGLNSNTWAAYRKTVYEKSVSLTGNIEQEIKGIKNLKSENEDLGEKR